MNRIEIIPAIDLIDGKCVRLTQGDYAQKKIYNENPLEVARSFEAMGIRRLHLVDLDGAKAGHVVNLAVLEQIAKHTTLVVDFGGGVKTAADVQALLDAGAGLVTIGSVAVKEPGRVQEWMAQFGAARFFLGADVRDEKIAVSGWLEQTDMNVYDFINDYAARGLTNVFCTDISRDGLLAGPATALYENILNRCPGIRLTASGGVSAFADVLELGRVGCAAVIIGKAIYEGRISRSELEQFVAQN